MTEPKRITLIQGHPDPAPDRFCRALANAYLDGEQAAGHEVRVVEIATLDFPLLRARDEWEKAAMPPGLANAAEAVSWADHLVIVYPLWLGDVPALLKAFLEQLMRPGFAFRYRKKGMPEKLLKGRSARLVVTMGMPGFFYELVYRAHSVKSLERNILGFVGVAPVRRTIVGMVEGGPERAGKWLERMRELGAAAR